MNFKNLISGYWLGSKRLNYYWHLRTFGRGREWNNNDVVFRKIVCNLILSDTTLLLISRLPVSLMPLTENTIPRTNCNLNQVNLPVLTTLQQQRAKLKVSCIFCMWQETSLCYSFHDCYVVLNWYSFLQSKTTIVDINAITECFFGFVLAITSDTSNKAIHSASRASCM